MKPMPAEGSFLHVPTAGWFMISLMSFLLLVVTFVDGITSYGLDFYGACSKAGQEVDMTYRQQNQEEHSQFFPLHNECNADYDLIPDWVNPALSLFISLTALSLCIFIVLAVRALVLAVKARIVNRRRNHV